MDDNRLAIRISDVLHDIGVPAHIKGYRYLMDGIILVIETPDYLNTLTKGLYPTVARKNDTTGSRVERAMRHAIEAAFDRSDPEVLQKYFGYTVSYNKGKPTNGEFIAIVVEWINLCKDGWNG